MIILAFVIAIIIFYISSTINVTTSKLEEKFNVVEYLDSLEIKNKITIGVFSEDEFTQFNNLIKDYNLNNYEVVMIIPKEFLELSYTQNLNDNERKILEEMKYELVSKQMEIGYVDIIINADFDTMDQLYKQDLLRSLKEYINSLEKNPYVHKGALDYFKNMSNENFYFISPTFSPNNFILLNNKYTVLNKENYFLDLQQTRIVHDEILENFASKGMTTFTFNSVLQDWEHIYSAFLKFTDLIDIPIVSNNKLFEDERWVKYLDNFFHIVKNNRFIYGTVGTGLGADWAYSQGVVGIKYSALYDFHRFYNEDIVVGSRNINIDSFDSEIYRLIGSDNDKEILSISSDKIAISNKMNQEDVKKFLDLIISESFAQDLILNSNKEMSNNQVPAYRYFNFGEEMPLPIILTNEIKDLYLNLFNLDNVKNIEVIFSGSKIKKYENNLTEANEKRLEKVFKKVISKYIDSKRVSNEELIKLLQKEFDKSN